MSTFWVPMADGGLKIDWAKMPTYNTIMAVAVGAGLIGLVLLGRELLHAQEDVSTDGWGLAFGALGLILFTTGLHMTLTWPLAAGGFPFDNIIFGETSLAFGVLLGASGLYLWRRGPSLVGRGADASEDVTAGVATGARRAVPDPVTTLARAAWPISIFIAGMGLGLFGIAAAGIRYQLFAAPPQEPISGAFADYPLIEAIFMSGLIALVGLGAVLFPFAVRSLARPEGRRTALLTVIGWAWGIAGVVLGLFGALNYFTHIGLIINTM
ncbi:MAG TPA: DUF981 family protein [Actinomycetales bacterium]|nr:DUF981 family protein [Actinomycetales bacterium]